MMTSNYSNNEILDLLRPTSHYRRRRRRGKSDFMKNKKLVQGIPPYFQRPKYKTRLPDYKIPPNIKKIFLMPEEDALATDKLKSLQLDNVSKYKKFFGTLLSVEECQIEENIKMYDQEGVKMKKTRSLFILDVPGLAEKRPSVIPGDHVFVVKCGETEGKEAYQGFVHHTEERSIALKFDRKFSKIYSENVKFNVRFTFNRISIRRMHLALESTEVAKRLFPSKEVGSHMSEGKIKRTMNNLKFIDKSIENNKYQKRAVAIIKLGLYHPAPFVVFGPPGTGKSVTIVEAMKQILEDEKDARILACAASNSAADGLLLKLITTLPRKKVVRINAISRNLENLDKKLLNFCGLLETTEIESHQVVVSTCITAGAIHALSGKKKKGYTHIFVDEAGQALEPEVMTALQNASRDTKIILAGDPKQLGPIVHSSIAKKFLLGRSLIERLLYIENTPYDFGVDCIYGVKLLKNYRSHLDILSVPNSMFYGNELEACGENVVTHSLVKSHILPKKGYPVKFVGVDGVDRREGHSPSWFNAHEAAAVLEMVRELVEKDHVRLEEIGIVTPYCKQVEKIKRLMEKWNFEGVDVGTVENFQGRERRVIIISTVRSSTAKVEHDKKFCLGFLNEPKRLCVAITRARALLAVVGNPKVLFLDDYWRRWLEEVKNRGGYTGEPLPEVIEENSE